MEFKLITPENIMFSGQAEEVAIPGEDGEFGVLTGHAAVISTLKPGVVTIHMADGTTKRLAISGGVAEAIPERCSVLAEMALCMDDTSAEQLQAQLSDAQKAFDKATEDAVIKREGQRLAMLEAATQS